MNYTFDNIAGYAREKEELKKLCDIIRNRNNYAKLGAKLPKGVIFYGETGTGKTLFAKVLANFCGLKLLTIDLGNFTDERSVSKKLKKAFSTAAKSSEPAMILFDEIDKVLPNAQEEYYTDISKAILAQLLTLIDGMDSSGNFVFVATCNNYYALPDTLVRPGRIDKKIHIGTPDYSSRVEILKLYSGKTNCRFQMRMEELAKLCPNFLCAALETLINECILHSDSEGYVSEQLIRNTILESSSQDLPRRPLTQSDIINACRNIGCLIVAKNFNDGDYLLRLGSGTVCNLFFNSLISYHDDDFDDEDGIDYNGDDENKISENDEYARDDDDYDDDDHDDSSENYFSENDYIQAVCVLMGGYVVEEAILHKTYDNVGTLLDTVDNVLDGMSYLGLLGPDLRYSSKRAQTMPYDQDRIDKINARYDKIVYESVQIAKEIVYANIPLIKGLIPELVKKRSLFKKQCEELIESLGGFTKCDLR